ncbi:hypothetical protein LXL04_012419 [Taraxacum kok-saghyz]
MDDSLLEAAATATRWVRLVPIKVNVFAWKMMWDALPTRWKLSQRGMDLDSILCPICASKVEDRDHVFFSCSFAEAVMQNVVSWWGVQLQPLASFTDWRSWFDSIHLGRDIKEIFEGLLFSANIPSKSLIFDEIVSQAFVWCSNRTKKKIDWGHKTEDQPPPWFLLLPWPILVLAIDYRLYNRLTGYYSLHSFCCGTKKFPSLALLNMETHGRDTILSSSQSTGTRRRIILFPLPFQGHINPMLQLANILHTQGFKITIIHTEYNSPDHSKYPHFTFKPISDGFSEIQSKLSTETDAGFILQYLNSSCEDSFRECLTGLLAEYSEGTIGCLITDAGFYFTQAVADSLKLPRMVLRTSSLACVLAYGALPFSSENGYFSLTKEDSDYEAPVPEFPVLKFKDVVKMTTNPEGMGGFVTKMLNNMKASSGLIWNTFKELEEPSLETIRQDFSVPSFTLGPFHKYFPASSSSLIEQDRSVLSWLDTQAPKSVIYVSFGSVALITESEFQEVAHGLANTGLPFLWAVRPGIVPGSKWLESLPEKFLERVGDGGCIVKWAPQQEVLAHPSTGCFWTHCGWNSTLESICEGVPMICSPCFVDQPINARYVSDVWKIGVYLEDGFDRVGIEMAIKRVMFEKEGEEIRERMNGLKEKVNVSLEESGSSQQSLKSLSELIKWDKVKRDQRDDIKRENSITMEEVDKKIDAGTSTEQDIIDRDKALENLWFQEKQDHENNKQKYKNKWCLEGDENSRLFH